MTNLTDEQLITELSGFKAESYCLIAADRLTELVKENSDLVREFDAWRGRHREYRQAAESRATALAEEVERLKLILADARIVIDNVSTNRRLHGPIATKANQVGHLITDAIGPRASLSGGQS